LISLAHYSFKEGEETGINNDNKNKNKKHGNIK
jgi:hypothetical protein